MSNDEFAARLEAYYNNELNKEERKQLEQEIASNPALQTEADQFAKVFATLKRAGEAEELKTKMNTLHKESIFGNYQPSSASIKLEPQKKKPVFSYAAAIAVLVIVIGGTLLFIQDLPKNDYVPLSGKSQNKSTSGNNHSRTIISSAPETRPSSSSILINKKGYLLTSAHMLKPDLKIEVEDADQHVYKARIIHLNRKLDYALLKIEDSTFQTPNALPLSFKKESSDIGEEVYTLGFPAENLVYQQGVISALLGYEGDSASYQVSIPLNPGNSGGPLFDKSGNMIGIVTGKQQNKDGVGFAVKLQPILKELSQADSLSIKFSNKSQTIAKSSRTKQIKTLQKFIYKIKVY